MDFKKIFLKYFILFFLAVFLIFNWGRISWIFHPGYLSRVISFYLFEKKEKPNIEEKEKIELGKTGKIESIEGKTQELKVQPKEELFQKEDSVEIPKIGISAPLRKVEREQEIKKELDKGVVLWPGSALPGEKGQTIILGHSAPPNWPKIKYDWVFSKINLLQQGDLVIVYFKKKKHLYSVQRKIFLAKGEKLPTTDPQKSVLFLISCWPPGKDFKRIAVEAEKIE